MMKKATLCCVCLLLTHCKEGLKAPDTEAAAPPAVAVAPPGMPAGHPPITAAGPTADGDIQGRIEAAPNVAKNIKAGDTIFLMARNSTTNAMVAVVKLSAPEKFPMEFKLGAQNVMIPGSSIAGPVKLSARVDKDGDAMSKNPGDVVGETSIPVPVPAKGVVLTLSQVL